MQYTTTKCPNCGYKTRNHESNVPKVQLGMPVMRCPQCGRFILDVFATEYEFMTEKERASFTTQSALSKGYLGNAVFIVFGLIMLLAGCFEAIAVLAIIGVACIAMGGYQIIRNQKMAGDKLMEQMIYQSLRRTSNEEYVRFVKRAYYSNGMSRTYLPMEDRDNYLEEHHSFEERSSYKKDMRDFEELCDKIEVDSRIQKSVVLKIGQG